MNIEKKTPTKQTTKPALHQTQPKPVLLYYIPIIYAFFLTNVYVATYL